MSRATCSPPRRRRLTSKKPIWGCSWIYMGRGRAEPVTRSWGFLGADQRRDWPVQSGTSPVLPRGLRHLFLQLFPVSLVPHRLRDGQTSRECHSIYHRKQAKQLAFFTGLFLLYSAMPQGQLFPAPVSRETQFSSTLSPSIHRPVSPTGPQALEDIIGIFCISSKAPKLSLHLSETGLAQELAKPNIWWMHK